MAFTESFYADWNTISIGAASISVLGAIILIMLSRLFGMKNLEQVGKTELVYAGSTVVIVMLIISVINFGEPLLARNEPLFSNGQGTSIAKSLYLLSYNISLSSYGSSTSQVPRTITFNVNGHPMVPNTLIDWMQLYMETPVGCVQNFMYVLYTMSIPVEAIASIFMEIFMSEHASGFGIKWISERIINASNSLSFYTYAFYLLSHTLNFIKYYAGFFFSVGVALRAFPPTRGAGAYIMALSFGLYFVFPLAYILIATVSLPHSQSLIAAPDVASMSATIPSGNIGYVCRLPTPPDQLEYACEAPSLGSAFDLPSRYAAVADNLSDMLQFKLLDFSRHLTSAICISPLVSFVILMTFVLNVTGLFGGSIPEVGRGLVKLI